MKSIKEINVINKKVILRCDLNVPIKDGIIQSDNKIIESLKTIKYLLNNNNSIIILSHLGKIKTEEDKKNTLYPVYLKLKELLNNNIYFSEETNGKNLTKLCENLRAKEIVLVENTRFEDLDGKKESGCNEELSKYWASLGNVFVNDAFGTSHRKHASNYGIKKYIESYYGLLVEKEINNLNELINNKKHPFTVIMGGAKVDDKLPIIKELINKCDNLIVGGGIANTFLASNNMFIGDSLFSEDYVSEIKEIYTKYKEKIILPIDFIVEDKQGEKQKRNLTNIKNKDKIYDIGSKTIKKYKKVLKQSKIVFVNGTVGLYENVLYKKGTLSIYKILNNKKLKVFIGGGDAVASVNKLGFTNTFYFKSTGGGATLEYIATHKLAALED